MPAPRTILVHEYVSGGGLKSLPETPSLGLLGKTILRAVLADMRAWGAARIVATWDARLAGPPPDADEVVFLDPDSHAATFARLAAGAYAVLVVAPEEGGILANLSETVLSLGARLLGSLPEGVRAAANKWTCRERLRQAGLSVPDGILATAKEALPAAREFGFPLVVKTVDGQGGLGVCLARDAVELQSALTYLEPKAAPLILERYQEGVHASVSLIASAGGVVPICLNGQDIRPGIPFAYLGGVTPLEHPAAAKALSQAAQAARAIPGLRGFVGVDMILAGDRCFSIEVNPRVTVAYAGVRRVVRDNLARIVAEACLDDVLPKRLEMRGRVRFGPEGIA